MMVSSNLFYKLDMQIVFVALCTGKLVKLL